MWFSVNKASVAMTEPTSSIPRLNFLRESGTKFSVRPILLVSSLTTLIFSSRYSSSDSPFPRDDVGIMRLNFV
jgi:hypothetical protein